MIQEDKVCRLARDYASTRGLNYAVAKEHLGWLMFFWSGELFVHLSVLRIGGSMGRSSICDALDRYWLSMKEAIAGERKGIVQ